MKQPLKGPHHFTGVTRDVTANVDFWCRVMGMRFVKNTLNFETTFRYHTYFGDEEGNPGSVVTFLEFKEAPTGVPGDGDIHRMVLRVGSYRFYFFSHEPNEPPHVHIDRDEATAKVWLESLELARSRGFRPKEINVILNLVADHRTELLEAWHDYFDTGD